MGSGSKPAGASADSGVVSARSHLTTCQRVGVGMMVAGAGFDAGGDASRRHTAAVAGAVADAVAGVARHLRLCSGVDQSARCGSSSLMLLPTYRVGRRCQVTVDGPGMSCACPQSRDLTSRISPHLQCECDMHARLVDVWCCYVGIMCCITRR